MEKRFLLVAGSRTFDDYDLLAKVMNENTPDLEGLVIVEGGAKGADSMAKAWADCCGVQVREFKPDWGKYGRAAGLKRNVEMVEFVREKGGRALYFWDGKSRGTRQCIDSAKKLGVPVTVWNTTENRYMD